jgi:protein tyrosine/serine phosphatase
MARVLMSVKQQYIDAAWEEMISRYGSIDLLLAKEFGVGEKEGKKLMEKYLG